MGAQGELDPVDIPASPESPPRQKSSTPLSGKKSIVNPFVSTPLASVLEEWEALRNELDLFSRELATIRETHFSTPLELQSPSLQATKAHNDDSNPGGGEANKPVLGASLDADTAQATKGVSEPQWERIGKRLDKEKNVVSHQLGKLRVLIPKKKAKKSLKYGQGDEVQYTPETPAHLLQQAEKVRAENPSKEESDCDDSELEETLGDAPMGGVKSKFGEFFNIVKYLIRNNEDSSKNGPRNRAGPNNDEAGSGSSDRHVEVWDYENVGEDSIHPLIRDVIAQVHNVKTHYYYFPIYTRASIRLSLYNDGDVNTEEQRSLEEHVLKDRIVVTIGNPHMKVLIECVLAVMIHHFKNDRTWGGTRQLWEGAKNIRNPKLTNMQKFVESLGGGVPPMEVGCLRSTLFVLLGFNHSSLNEWLDVLAHSKEFVNEFYEKNALLRHGPSWRFLLTALSALDDFSFDLKMTTNTAVEVYRAAEQRANSHIIAPPEIPVMLKEKDQPGESCDAGEATLGESVSVTPPTAEDEKSQDQNVVSKWSSIRNEVASTATLPVSPYEEVFLRLGEAVSLVADYFNAAEKESWKDIGAEANNPNLRILVRGKLCTALAGVFFYGFKSYKLFGEYHVWDFIDTAAGKLILTDIAALGLHKGVVAVNGLNKHIKTPGSKYAKNVKFRALVCLALQHNLLNTWLHILANVDSAVQKFYEPHAIMRTSLALKRISDALGPLKSFPFSIVLDYEVRSTPSGAPPSPASQASNSK